MQVNSRFDPMKFETGKNLKRHCIIPRSLAGFSIHTSIKVRVKTLAASADLVTDKNCMKFMTVFCTLIGSNLVKY